MARHHSDRLSRPPGTNPARGTASDRLAEQDRLLHRICELGGQSSVMSNPVTDAQLDHLRRVVAWEDGPFTTHRDWLARRGHAFPPLIQISPARLEAELWRLIRALAHARVFLMNTGHLSDAELYLRLTSDVLADHAPDIARTPTDICCWPIVGPNPPDTEI
jgi:hypothetical protein